MKAVVVKDLHSKPLLEWSETLDVTVEPKEVLVNVYATAVNRADLAQALGKYPPPPGESEILGLEMAGVVVEVGPQVERWKEGDRVFALLGGGGYAEQAAVHEDMLLKIPEGWSYHHAAAVPEVWLTAYVNLIVEGEMRAGEIVLLHAGASGVGTAAVQLCKTEGSTVIVTVGSSSKQEACLELGADVAINYKQDDFYKAATKWLNGEKVDLILDPVGGPYLESNIKLLGRFGRLISIGTLGGAEGNLDISALLGRRLKLIGSTLRSRPLEEKIQLSHSFWDRFQAHFLTGGIRPVIDTVFPIEEAQAAHEYLRENRNIGKVILAVRE